LALPALSAEDLALLNNLVPQFLALSSRVDRVEGLAHDTARRLDELALRPPGSVNISAQTVYVSQGETISITHAPGATASSGTQSAPNLLRQVAAMLEAGPAGGPAGGNQVPAPAAERSVADLLRDGEERYAALSRLLEEWEFDAAFVEAGQFADWVIRTETSLPSPFVAQSYALLGEIEIIRARNRKLAGLPFDAERAQFYLARATDASSR
jgi:hypothetical protein